MKQMLSILLALSVLLALSCAASEADIFVTPVSELPEGFLLGADVSSALALERSGCVFLSERGEAQDLMLTLAEHGLNCVRLRVWNDPYDSQGRGYGGGNNDIETAITLGARATRAGLGVMIDFHYSDFWADPSKQMAPKAWAGMSVEEKITAIYDYTYDSIIRLEDAGVNVVMVQIGNETNGKMCGETAFSQVTKLLKSAAKAVRAADADIRVAVHFTNPETPDNYVKYAQQLWRAGVDYDVFASSWYPYWHGTLDNLNKILSRIARDFDKQVMIAEVSYAYTYLDGDGFSNGIYEGVNCVLPYSVSPQGQANCIRDAVQAVVDTGRGAGVIYWEAAWLPVSGSEDEKLDKWQKYGSGWATSYAAEYDPDDAGQWWGGTSCENQALFDFDGRPLPSLSVFKYLLSGAQAPLRVDSVMSPQLTVRLGDDVIPPDTVLVTYNDSSTALAPVVWESADYTAMSSGGVNTYTVKGVAVIDGYRGDTVLTINIVDKNYIDNPSFELDDISMWVIDDKTGEMSELYVIDKLSDAVTGSKSMHFYSPTPIEFTVEQRVTGLAPGAYNFYVTLHGGDASQSEMYIYAVADGVTYTRETGVSGWRAFDTPRIDSIPCESGEILVGAYIKCGSGGWGNLDDFTLAPVE